MTEKMVLHIGVDLVPKSGGTYTAVLDFAKADRGKIVSLTSPLLVKQAGGIDDVQHICTLHSTLGSRFGLIGPRQAYDLLCLVKNSDVVVIHVLFRFHLVVSALFAVFYRKPYVIIPHGSLDPYVMLRHPLLKWIWLRSVGAFIFRRARGVVMTTRFEINRSMKLVALNNIAQIYLPVELPASSRPRRSDLARKLCGQDKRVVLFLGRLHPMKRVLETIEYFNSSSCENSILLIVGPDDVYSATELRQRVAALQDNRIFVYGPAYGDEKSELLSGAHLLVLLSHRENFGYAVAEAMAYALPLFLSAGNGLVHEPEAGKGSFVWDNGDPRSATAIFEAIDRAPDSGLREMGLYNEWWVRRHLSRKCFEMSYSSLLESVLAGYTVV